MSDMLSRLRALKEAHAEGLIDNDEFAAVGSPPATIILLHSLSAVSPARQNRRSSRGHPLPRQHQSLQHQRQSLQHQRQSLQCNNHQRAKVHVYRQPSMTRR